MVYLPKPPCFQLKCFRGLLEENVLCFNIGKIGFKWFDKHRVPVMAFASLITIVCIILNTVSVWAISMNNDDIRNTCWTRGFVDNGLQIFVGLNKIVVDFNGTTTGFEWDSGCSVLVTTDGGDETCQQCKAACADSVKVAIVSLITFIPTLQTDIQRSTREGDMNCQKFVGVFTAFMGALTTIVAMRSYAEGCLLHLPEQFAGREVGYERGPGFICLLLATFLKIVDFFVHVLTPVVPIKDVAVATTASHDLTSNNSSSIVGVSSVAPVAKDEPGTAALGTDKDEPCLTSAFEIEHSKSDSAV